MYRGFLLFIIISLPFRLWAQSEVLVKIQFMPRKNYHNSTHITSEGVVTIKADSIILEAMKKHGRKNPSTVRQEETIITNTKTENKQDDGKIPFTMKMDTVSVIRLVNDTLYHINPFSSLDSTLTVTGYYYNDSLKIQNIKPTKLGPFTNVTLKKYITNLTRKVKFPDSLLKIGDSFKHEVPIKMPIMGTDSLGMVINTTYTLSKIESGLAIFDIKQDYTAEGDFNGIKASTSTNGGGKAVYNIVEKQLVEFKTESKSTTIIEAGYIKTTTVTNDTSDVQTTVDSY